MAHEIDETTGTAAIAYVGEAPWHGLGSRLTEGATIDEWRVAAKLDWKVDSGDVYFDKGHGQPVVFPDRKALYRNDTGAPLSIVSKSFNIVQPGDVLEFFRKLCDDAGFKMETAGALRGGRRIWALARIAEGFKIAGDDEVRPFVLLSTAYDATMATWARNCFERVVCANTIAIAENEKGKIVRVPHNAKLDFEDVRLQLGLALNTYERFKVNALKLADRETTDVEAEAFLRELLGVHEDATPRGFLRILDLFKGAQIGANKRSTRQTLWGVVQAVAEHVDHNPYSRGAETRLDSAWFGAGNDLKVRAFRKALEIIDPQPKEEETATA